MASTCFLKKLSHRVDVRRLAVGLALTLIRGYQVLLSPLIGPCCRFYPSCSRYAAEGIQRYGICKGGLLSLRRILKCHPLHPGGVDPVP